MTDRATKKKVLQNEAMISRMSSRLDELEKQNMGLKLEIRSMYRNGVVQRMITSVGKPKLKFEI